MTTRRGTPICRHAKHRPRTPAGQPRIHGGEPASDRHETQCPQAPSHGRIAESARSAGWPDATACDLICRLRVARGHRAAGGGGYIWRWDATGRRQSNHKYFHDIITVLIIDSCLWILCVG